MISTKSAMCDDVPDLRLYVACSSCMALVRLSCVNFVHNKGLHTLQQIRHRHIDRDCFKFRVHCTMYCFVITLKTELVEKSLENELCIVWNYCTVSK